MRLQKGRLWIRYYKDTSREGPAMDGAVMDGAVMGIPLVEIRRESMR